MLTQRRFSKREWFAPTVRLNEDLDPLLVLPEPADGVQRAGILRRRVCRIQLVRQRRDVVEFFYERRRSRMGDGSKKFSNDLVGCNAPSGQRAPERYGVAAHGAAREVIAKDVGHPTILDPPVLGAGA